MSGTQTGRRLQAVFRLSRLAPERRTFRYFFERQNAVPTLLADTAVFQGKINNQKCCRQVRF